MRGINAGSQMRPETRRLLLKIARCEVLQNHVRGQCAGCDCEKIIESQRDQHGQVVGDLTKRQIPEPWSGHIETAPLMFMSSNPSISDETDPTKREHYPDGTWTDDEIVAFFSGRWDHRFVDNKRHRTVSGAYWPPRGVRYWNEVHRRAQEIFAADAKASNLYRVTEVRPGDQYVLTEVVHCKSKNNKGVREALPTCESYLEPMLNASGASVIIIVGRIAWGLVRPMMQDATEAKELEHVQYYRTKHFGRERHFLFVEAPGGPHPRRLPKVLADDMDILQRLHQQVTNPPSDTIEQVESHGR